MKINRNDLLDLVMTILTGIASGVYIGLRFFA